MSVVKVSAGRGASWIGESMKLVTDRPGAWIGGTAVAFGLTFVFNLIPWIGWILNQILQLLIIVLAFSFAHAQIHRTEFDLDTSFQNVKSRLMSLVLMMIISAGCFSICALPVLGALTAVGGTELLMQKQNSVPDMSLTSTLIVGFAGLISCIAAIVTFAATFFTTPLILFRNLSIGNAILLSLKAVRLNLGALLIYALTVCLLLFVCLIPLGLGLIFGLPTSLASLCVIYEELLGKVEGL